MPSGSETVLPSCVNHPLRKTVLRCNKCERPVCRRFVGHTPVGYRCKRCIERHKDGVNPARWYDYCMAAMLPALMSASAGLLFIPPLCFLFALLAPVVGRLSADLVRLATRRRRGRYLLWAAVVGIFLGSLAAFTSPLFLLLGGIVGAHDTGMLLLVLIWPSLYVVGCVIFLWRRFRQLQRQEWVIRWKR